MGLLLFFFFLGGGTLTLPLPAVLLSNITDNMEDFILTYTISLLLSSYVVIIAIAEMKVPSAKGREQSNGSSVKYKARSERSFPCFAFEHNSDFLTSASSVHSTSFFPSLFKHEMQYFLKSESVVWVMLLSVPSRPDMAFAPDWGSKVKYKTNFLVAAKPDWHLQVVSL